MKSELVDIEMDLTYETDKAILAHTGDPDEAVWLPKSQIEVYPVGNRGLMTVTMPRWLAEEKGLV